MGYSLVRNNDGPSPPKWVAILVCKRKNTGNMAYNDVASSIALTIRYSRNIFPWIDVSNYLTNQISTECDMAYNDVTSCIALAIICCT